MPKPRPNIVLIMADQLAAPALAVYGNRTAKTPHIDRLAGRGMVFENAYCNYPQCAPSRFSMLTGCLPSQVGAYDNAAEFPASVPTLMHYLRLAGYKTCLSGKMHFVGPDQLHGFEERLTTEIYPSDFTWCPDWEAETLSYEWSHRLKVISESGICARSMQLDYDEQVAFQAEQKIYDYARARDGRPFFLTVSFTHPHNPYVITKEYWNRYRSEDIDMPAVPPIPMDNCDPHSQRLYHQFGLDVASPSETDVRNTRHAYYAMTSYVDDKVAQLLRALENSGLSDETVVIFASDHGDMLGERGLFYKMTFFEWSARVPLIISPAGALRSRRCNNNVSLVDLLPTLVGLAELPKEAIIEPVAGHSLLGLLEGDDTGWPDVVYAEYMAEGTLAPCFMVRRGRHKLIYSETDPVQLFDLVDDPLELTNLAERGESVNVVEELMAELFETWDPPQLRALAVQSQRRRRLVQRALHSGRYIPWDFQPLFDASQQYIRSGGSVADMEPRSRLAPKQ